MLNQFMPFPVPVRADNSLKDPVWGMTVAPQPKKYAQLRRYAQSRRYAEFDGATFYFCSAGCRVKFVAAPDNFVKPHALQSKVEPQQVLSSKTGLKSSAVPMTISPAVSSTEQGNYTCPMHAEILRHKPGDCPICGMALVPMLGSNAGNLESKNVELHALKRRLWTGIALTLPLVVLAMSPMVGIDHPFGLLPPTTGWLQMLLGTPTVLWVGASILRKFWLSLAHRALNMYTLIGLGVGLAYVFSLVAVFLPQFFPPEFQQMDGSVATYFAPAVVIVTLMMLGDYLQLRAMNDTSTAIQRLLQLAPYQAWRIRDDGVEEQVPLANVVTGDRLRVKQGNKILVDGVVLGGASHVNESMITGEPMPVAKAINAPVTGATVNGNGSMVIRAERVGSATLLAQIVPMVGEAQRTRAPIQKLADMIAAYFVQIVVAIAIATALVWWFVGPEPKFAYAFINVIAVLIIACPCAVGLATPISMTVAIGQGAWEGILFRNAEAIERMRDVDTLVVDKTGTLTLGHPTLTDFAEEGMAENEAPALAQADEDIAMKTGTDVAMESTGVTRVKRDLRGIVRTRMLSRATMRNIRQNLAFALGYNALGIPLAAGVLYLFFGLLRSPMFAGAAMALSSVSVVTNALRLNRVKL